MVRRCSWRTCTMDCRYPEMFKGVTFKTFPNPKTNMEKCMRMRWIKACGRPHYQHNVDKINKNKVICSTEHNSLVM
ncbi:hypothetical protein DPMN_109452 [Dreissena polymorpha]|uniref:THAP-type domain-containing protein n=1 Tax=Dreissena polymorpha TaxID=45954 RepID=A0A9D4QM04_DREPO|nr:hypothetical protein DPMN_109452 [Dreissena polymorpha]